MTRERPLWSQRYHRLRPFHTGAEFLTNLGTTFAIQTLSSAMMMQQFKEVHNKINSIMNALNIVLARMEATHVCELLADSSGVDQVYLQYELEGSFSSGCLLRLDLAERDTSGLAVRGRYPDDTPTSSSAKNLGEIHRAHFDAHRAMFASFIDLRIVYLCVCVGMQEEPKSVNTALEQLKAKLEDNSEF